MKHRSVDLLIVLAITIVIVALVFLLPSDNLASHIFTLPLVLVLPGYALTSAMLPERAFRFPERLVFTLGLSLVIVVLGGLVLNWTPFGLRASSWSVLLGGITLTASTFALIRRRGQSMPTLRWWGIGNIGLTFRQGLLLGLAVVVVSGAVVVSISGAVQQPHPGFTQLWILPVSGATPKNAVRLGVNSMELTTMEYRLDVSVDGQSVKVWASINLKSNEKWEATFMIPQTNHTGAARVEAQLYRVDAPTKIYRHVELWIYT